MKLAAPVRHGRPLARLALLRKAATRTLEALWTAVGALLSAFNADECANYFANAGYGTLVVKAL
jgi:hypothetical protein